MDLVIFDYDGTLCHTRPAIIHCIKQAFIAHGIAFPDDDAIVATIRAGVTLQETFSRLAPELERDTAASQDMVNTYRSIYREEAEELLTLFAGVTETLRELHARKIRCAIASNKGVEAVLRSVEAFQLAPYIDLIIGEQPGIPQKPDPLLLTDHVIPKFPGIDRRRVLMVGDTEADIALATGAGVWSCWAEYGYGHADRCSALSPDYRISAIRQVLAL